MQTYHYEDGGIGVVGDHRDMAPTIDRSFKKGQNVRHSKYGPGHVLQVTKYFVVIDFDGNLQGFTPEAATSTLIHDQERLF